MNHSTEISTLRIKLLFIIGLGAGVSYFSIYSFFNSYCGLSILVSRFLFNSIVLTAIIYYYRDKFTGNKLDLSISTEIYSIFFLLGYIIFHFMYN